MDRAARPTTVTALPALMDASGQGLTLVQFSAGREPLLVTETIQCSQRIPQKVLTSSRKVDERKRLPRTRSAPRWPCAGERSCRARTGRAPSSAPSRAVASGEATRGGVASGETTRGGVASGEVTRGRKRVRQHHAGSKRNEVSECVEGLFERAVPTSTPLCLVS